MLSYRLDRSRERYLTAFKLRWVAGVLFAAAFATLGAYLLISTHAATTEQPSVNWKSSGSELLNKNANLCLGTPGNVKPAAGTTVIIESCGAVDNEKWSLTWGSGTIKQTTVVNGYGQCLDDRGSSAGLGTTVRIYTCTTNDAAQVWTTGYGDGTIRIDGLCLGVSGNATSAGTDTILTPCNTPLPSVRLTAPASGSTVSSTTTVAASASISQDSIAKITLQAGGTVLNTCTNTTSCSASWNTTTVTDGTYTLTAVATGALGGTATASETVTSSNAPPSGGSGSGSGGGDTGGSGGSSGSTSRGIPISTCDPSDPTCNGGSSVCDPSDPTCSTTSTDTTGGTVSSGSPGTTQSPPTRSKGHTTPSPHSSNTSVKSVLGISALLVAFIIIGFLVFVYLKRRKRVSAPAENNSSDFFADIAPYVGSATTPLPNNQPNAQTTQELPTPKNPYEDIKARLNWWQADGQKHPAQPASHDDAADRPPDMFEEGRKRLEKESKEGRVKF